MFVGAGSKLKQRGCDCIWSLLSPSLTAPTACSPAQEAQKIFKAKLPMDGTLGGRLAGFGMQLLEGVDPNPENFVCRRHPARPGRPGGLAAAARAQQAGSGRSQWRQSVWHGCWVVLVYRNG